MALVKVTLNNRADDWSKIEYLYNGEQVATMTPKDEYVVFQIPFDTNISVTQKVYRNSGDIDTATIRFATAYTAKINSGEVRPPLD